MNVLQSHAIMMLTKLLTNVWLCTSNTTIFSQFLVSYCVYHSILSFDCNSRICMPLFFIIYPL